MTEFDVITKAAHYNQHPSGVEAIDIKRHLSSNIGDAFKYVFRAEFKGGRQDLEKAHYYLADALAHHDPARPLRLAVFLPTWRYRHQQLLDRVAAAETNPNRAGYFRALMKGDVEQMLGHLDRLLSDWPISP
jgi:hypothetical protein